MRFKLTLLAKERSALLPFNYQYPFSSAIYKIIQRADKEFAAFLHDKGYGEGHKKFKLFTFSDIRTPFQKRGDRMQLLSGEAELVICFYLPKAAEHFIQGLFMHQQLEVADHRSKVVFMVTGVESMAEVTAGAPVLMQPLSPVVVGRKNERGHYDYRSPEDADFADCLVYNWVEKYAAIHEVEEELLSAMKKAVQVSVKLYPHPPQQRLITIKGGTAEETKIRGYTKFRMEVRAPGELLEVALGAGMGLHNAQGMGCVGVV